MIYFNLLVIKENNNINNINPKINKKYDFNYELYLNNTLIGIAAITLNSDDMLYIHIYEKHRGNNLGKEAFDVLIQKFKELNIKKVSIIVDNNNIKMIRILSYKKFKIANSGLNFKCYEINI